MINRPEIYKKLACRNHNAVGQLEAGSLSRSVVRPKAEPSMAPPMHEIKRDGLVNMIKKDLHNLNLMLKGHELSPHRHGKPHPAAASRQDERVLIVDDFLTVRGGVEIGNACESVGAGVDTIKFRFVTPRCLRNRFKKTVRCLNACWLPTCLPKWK